MKLPFLLFIVTFFLSSTFIQAKNIDNRYIVAYQEMSDMLQGKIPISIKRATFLAEWAYLDGELDYEADFNNEILRITTYLNKFISANNLSYYKTGKQIALNEYFFKPWSGNNYKPYYYNFEKFTNDNDNWTNQFVCNVLKTHEGQCRSLPWLYKILAEELGANVYIAKAPKHCYIMYRNEDNYITGGEEWVNLELTTHQYHPSSWIKKDFMICDSAVIVGTYMTPLTNIETIACQLADLALGYWKKYHHFNQFTYDCVNKSLKYYPNNPTAIIIKGKSLCYSLQNYINLYGFNPNDPYINSLVQDIANAEHDLNMTYLTESNDSIEKRRKEQTIEAYKYTNKYLKQQSHEKN